MKQLIVITALLLSAAILLPGQQGHAFDWGKKKKVESNDPIQVSTVYTGTIGDNMTVGSQDVVLTHDVLIYVIGEGIRRSRMFVTDTPVAVSGKQHHGILYADQVIVGASRSLAELVTDSQEGENRIASLSNSSVGELNEGSAH
jgi:hypothetical protein